MAVVRFKEGVTIVPSPAGARILAALDYTAQFRNRDVTVTSGSDGDHSGPDDPHHHGNAYDVRTHDDPDKYHLWQTIANRLSEISPGKFFSFIEDPNTDNEHIHCQLRHGMEIT